MNKEACVVCGNPNTSLHHVFFRRHKGLKNDPDNLLPLCLEHHTGSSEFSAHGTRDKFKEWAREYIGEEKYEELRIKSTKIFKYGRYL